MTQIYQTYVTKISKWINGYPGELLAIDLLEHFSPMAAQILFGETVELLLF